MTEPKQITLTIDGQEVQVNDGLTLMQAIESGGKEVPTICYHEATTPYGICRQCVVEVEGWRVLAPACVTQAGEGMVIFTDSERVQRARRTILEMLDASVDLSEAPELQDQFEAYQVDRERFPRAKERQPGVLGENSVIDDNPFYVRDYAKCVMCWRCVQACGDDIQFTYSLSVGGRGHDSKISTFFSAPMPETTCVFCGNCVAVCPTNALKNKTEFFMEQGLNYDQIRLEKRKARRQGKKERKND